MRDGSLGRLAHKLRQRAAIGVAEHDKIGARIVRRFDRCQRVLRILVKAVEKMLRIVEDFPPVLFEKANGIAIMQRFSSRLTPKTSVTCSGQVFPTIVTTGVFASRSICTWESSSTLIRPRRVIPKAAILRMLPFALRRFLEKRRVFRIRAGPAALNIVDPKGIQLLGHTNLIEHREGDSGALRSVPQSRVVER